MEILSKLLQLTQYIHFIIEHELNRDQRGNCNSIANHISSSGLTLNSDMYEKRSVLRF